MRIVVIASLRRNMSIASRIHFISGVSPTAKKCLNSSTRGLSASALRRRSPASALHRVELIKSASRGGSRCGCDADAARAEDMPQPMSCMTISTSKVFNCIVSNQTLLPNWPLMTPKNNHASVISALIPANSSKIQAMLLNKKSTTQQVASHQGQLHQLPLVCL
jgi:hypothetical protein